MGFNLMDFNGISWGLIYWVLMGFNLMGFHGIFNGIFWMLMGF
jgi:hypothetical protein